MYPVEVRLTPVNHNDGRVSPIIGIVIHATRSGVLTPGFDDYEPAINTFWNPTCKASAHRVVRGDGQRCVVVADWDTAWHAGWLNPSTLGVEVCQPTINTPYTDDQVLSTAEQCDLWCAVYNIPRTPDFVKGHENTAQGIAWGKSDPGPLFPWDDFFNLLEAGMAIEDKEARLRQKLAGLILTGKPEDQDEAYWTIQYLRLLAGQPVTK